MRGKPDVTKRKTGKGTRKSAKSQNAVIRYLRETRAELRKVHWPTRDEAWNLTKIVLGVTISMAILLGLLDYLFAIALSGLLAGNATVVGILVFLAAATAVAVVVLNRQAAR